MTRQHGCLALFEPGRQAGRQESQSGFSGACFQNLALCFFRKFLYVFIFPCNLWSELKCCKPRFSWIFLAVAGWDFNRERRIDEETGVLWLKSPLNRSWIYAYVLLLPIGVAYSFGIGYSFCVVAAPGLPGPWFGSNTLLIDSSLTLTMPSDCTISHLILHITPLLQSDSDTDSDTAICRRGPGTGQKISRLPQQVEPRGA